MGLIQGSGKTLAYGLPILNALLSGPAPPLTGRRPLQALILCPTRELALQVTKHLTTLVNIGLGLTKPTTTSDDSIIVKEEIEDTPLPTSIKKKSGPPRISIISIVGGLSILKQRRFLTRGADIIVATPGRLWDLCKEDEELTVGIKGIKFLVVDEADRMIENGHFAELESIVGLTVRSGDSSA
jgi:ATP-dependent RNA helicase DDX24/MAK5